MPLDHQEERDFRSSSFTCLQELCSRRAVDDAVVAAHRHAHALADLNLPSITTAFASTPPIARIPASGGLMIAVNWSMPNMPRFETENVEPVYCSGVSFLLSCESGEFASLLRISHRCDLRSASKITGVMRPSGIATAIPTCTRLKWRMCRPSSARSLPDDRTARSLLL